MARRGGRPSGRFFVYTALTALAVIIAKDRVEARAGSPIPTGRMKRRAP
jgi:hypothetical protein